MDIPNTQWTWIIVDADMGSASVVGTDDYKVACAAALEDTNCVVNLKTAQQLIVDQGVGNPEVHNIPEQTLYKF